MKTTSGDRQSPLGPQLCGPPTSFLPDHAEDDGGITLFRGMLIAGTASIVLWGICIVLLMMLRSMA